MMHEDSSTEPGGVPEEAVEEEGGPTVESLKAHSALLKDQALRYAAEAENTRRRAEREVNDARAYAIQKFSKDLLGVADNLARALDHAPRDAADPAVRNLTVGLEMTQKALLAAFERNGLKPLDPAPGVKFDPHLHQAMMEQTADDIPAGCVIQVLQTGYELFGRTVRPAMVVVAAKSSGVEAKAAMTATADGASDSAGGENLREAEH